MNKKGFLKVAGIIATVVAISGSAFACHLFSKKTSNQNDSDNKNKENQNIIKEENNKKEYIEMRTMYGIPMDRKLELKSDETKNNEDVIIIEKYGIPIDPDEDKRILKYAVPKIIPPFQKSIKKYDVPYYEYPPEVKYGIPEYMDNPPLLKYAMPHIPPEETKE